MFSTTTKTGSASRRAIYASSWLLAGLCLTACRGAESPAEAPAAAPSAAVQDDAKPAVQEREYMGRTLARTMSHHGADWLTRDNRDDEENTTRMHEHLGLGPGMTACDLGAGNGYHSLLMASAVSPEGSVYASDLQPEMLELLRTRAKAAGTENVVTLQATDADPKFPAGACDRILIVDVYHELSDPPAVLERLRASLSATGEIVLLEYRAEDPDVPIRPLHKMSKAQILAEYEASGLALTREFDDLPWQHMMFFAPADRGSAAVGNPSSGDH